MRLKAKNAVVLLLVMLVSACSSQRLQPDKATIDSVVIRNQTNHPVHDVTLRIPANHGVISCSTILAHSECSLGFSLRQNNNNPALLSWTYRGHTYQEPLKGPPGQADDLTQQAVITIVGEGIVIARLKDHR
ncbi:Uncharacterised protein [BD1-7 clade bacterium]|uniref:Lipoprotein n=1 Tax=BD1-7 clade bacterium TaxID=2029982 RepID=A0A5S9NPE7_9GAMM|nr:Uncharacterised protein [BD1-7 clade bacterium]